ncbi:MAG: hypothetical protein C5B48_15775 [Candidatus Rokuibacteriota bacterium]|nr:MAG: hypothetical protein C5B48_15775 [Candidatus Rokubacteria bacterium]
MDAHELAVATWGVDWAGAIVPELKPSSDSSENESDCELRAVVTASLFRATLAAGRVHAARSKAAPKASTAAASIAAFAPAACARAAAMRELLTPALCQA